MIISTDIPTLQNPIHAWKKADYRIAFVPTMGNLHQGHVDLVKHAQRVADKTIVSIFVNPLQFGPQEDFERYPRTQTADIQTLTEQQVDVVFLPELNLLYPNGDMPITRVSVPGLSDDLCGRTRPNLFYGVTTIVCKLFNLIQPDIAIFGEKDFQQTVIIKQMVQDLNFPIDIVTVPTTREPDHLAMSSRNQYLSQKERQIAPALYRALLDIKQQLEAGNTRYQALCEAATQHLTQLGFKVDYLAIRTEDTLQEPTYQTNHLVILGAAFLGATRLIDNIKVVLLH